MTFTKATPPAKAARSALRFALIGASIVGILLVGSCTLGAVGTVIDPGNVGVKIKTLGTNAGIDPAPYGSGWQFKGIGEHFIQYPAITRQYTYTREKDERGPENEEITFSDNNALPMTADVQVALKVNPGSAPNLYKTYRLSFDQLFEGPIRNDVRSAVAAETELVPVEYLYKGGRQAVILKALVRLQKKWSHQGIEISQLDWIGNIRYPQVILDSIQAKTKADADTLSAQARVSVSKAEADALVEQARGRAESTRLEAEALRANPEVLRQREIERWKGLCPLNTTTCIIGGNAEALVDLTK